ncbi:Ferrous iron transport protein B [Staphylococcus aureus]|uniref:nucleoside recognition domain-containing protein n=1 Tax=Staphylococcus aureus TaxID=1280 RepID=UPI0001DA24B6|nr:nucleoside recognition domain-containing protein [Staphylococcus aureus]ADI99067.1 probable membrane protein [Staphylococcus aureus subsp. aureus ED133]QBY49539.1 Ferrous iron transport protein B [Staphylococcus aureus]HEB2164818.1 ferrous iron transporter B [Staphylococcus aureus]HEB2170347.1 ferrous iron transporter B [Staphylococcus aureus]HEB2200120.1 ferrous iron transporter B [Staphylococcus aureus]
MLEVKYDMRTGHYTPIPHEPHYLVISHADKLTATEKAKLRLLIIKQKLDISLAESVVSSPIASEHVIEQLTLFQHERRQLRPKISATFLAWLLIFLMFALPIGIAYQFSDWFQNQYVSAWIEYLTQTTLLNHDILQHILFGDYGVLSLGTYSLVWALPVVILISLSTAIIDQTGFKSWMIWTIEPSMLRIGLQGNDIVPLLEGFGCNAAAISQAAHQCHTCTKTQCMSLISFGSSCSYQIGATLSIFSVAGKSWLFMPYLILVLLGGILHNRIWLKKNDQQLSVPLPHDRQLHVPNIRQMLLQMWQNIQMFIVQALPILSLLGISSELSPGILFSMIRKDGMLLFNLHQGALLQGMTATQLLLLVFFSSTFTACSVTMTMLLKHLGGQSALKLIGKQMVTSLSLVIGVGIIVKIVMLII